MSEFAKYLFKASDELGALIGDGYNVEEVIKTMARQGDLEDQVNDYFYER